MYLQGLTIILAYCDAECGSCVGASNNCTSCVSVQGVDYFLQPSGSGCLTTCPTGYIGDANQLVCLARPCHSTCGSCTSKADASACDSCSSPEM